MAARWRPVLRFGERRPRSGLRELLRGPGWVRRPQPGATRYWTGRTRRGVAHAREGPGRTAAGVGPEAPGRSPGAALGPRARPGSSTSGRMAGGSGWMTRRAPCGSSEGGAGGVRGPQEGGDRGRAGAEGMGRPGGMRGPQRRGLSEGSGGGGSVPGCEAGGTRGRAASRAFGSWRDFFLSLPSRLSQSETRCCGGIVREPHARAREAREFSLSSTSAPCVYFAPDEPPGGRACWHGRTGEHPRVGAGDFL